MAKKTIGYVGLLLTILFLSYCQSSDGGYADQPYDDGEVIIPSGEDGYIGFDPTQYDPDDFFASDSYVHYEAEDDKVPTSNTEGYVDMSPVPTKGAVTDGIDAANKYFQRFTSTGNLNLTVEEESDIWYLYTNTTANDISLPSSSGTYGNNYNSSYKNKPIKSFINPRTFCLENGKYLDNYSKDYIYCDKEPMSQEEIDRLNAIAYKQHIKSGGEESPLGDFIGKKMTFIDQKWPIMATCDLIRTVDTAYGKRTLVIYKETDVSGIYVPTKMQIKKYADCFLKEGYNNDLYDILTASLGSDWGKANATWLKKNATSGKDDAIRYFMPKDNTITILFCNIHKSEKLRQGTIISLLTGYIAGYFSQKDIYKKSYYKDSNERNMVTLHAPLAGSDYLGQGLTTLAHEFQHLIQNQYTQNMAYEGYPGYTFETSTVTQETFSTAVETFLAQWIQENDGHDASGPFYVSYKYNEKGYLDYSDVDETIRDCQRGSDANYMFDQNGLDEWNNASGRGYGVPASFGAYMLINYGLPLFKGYIAGDTSNLDGIVKVINNKYTNANIDLKNLIADFGVASLLSAVPNLNAPYAFNARYIICNNCKTKININNKSIPVTCHSCGEKSLRSKSGWYILNNNENYKVPSINLWLYGNSEYVRSKGGESTEENITGIPSSLNSVLKAHGNLPILKRAKVAANTKLIDEVEVPNGTIVTVIAVPTNKHNRV